MLALIFVLSTSNISIAQANDDNVEQTSLTTIAHYSPPETTQTSWWPPATYTRYTIPWTFVVYTSPDFRSEVKGTFSSQAVRIVQMNDDGWALIITDGGCEKLVLYGREHAFLLPQGAALPFVPKGKVFRMKR